MTVPGEVDCVCNESAGTNRKARGIVSLRNPRTIFIPCFAHESALANGNVISYTAAAEVVHDCLHLVNSFNASSSKWLPRLRNAMQQTGGVTFAMVASVITKSSQWATVGLCISSLRGLNTHFVSCLHLFPAEETQCYVPTMQSYQRSSVALRLLRVRYSGSNQRSICGCSYRRLSQSRRSSLVLQGSASSLGDVLYTKVRHYRRLEDAEESRTMEPLESRWAQLEQHLLLLAFLSIQTTESKCPE